VAGQVLTVGGRERERERNTERDVRKTWKTGPMEEEVGMGDVKGEVYLACLTRPILIFTHSTHTHT